MLYFHTLASGSGGNALLVCGSGTNILIDAGISWRRITAALSTLGLTADDLSGVLVTHEHSDHVCGIATMVKHSSVPVYVSRGTARELNRRIVIPAGQLRIFSAGDSFTVGGLMCCSFPTSHDAADSVGYTVEQNGRKLALATDLGCVTPEVSRAVLGANAVIVESNHDVDWLRSGTYPYALQQRILGDRGHLSNEAGAELVSQAVQAGANTVVLAHLSRENNTPARAYDVAFRRLAAEGFDPEVQVQLLVASQSEVGPKLEVSEANCIC